MEYRDYPNSTNVSRIAWYPSVEAFNDITDADALVDVLTIRFRNGACWAYWPVAPQQWEQLRDLEGSIGSLVHKAIVLPARRQEYSSRLLPGADLGEINVSAAQQELDRQNADADRFALSPGETPPAPADSVQTQPAANPPRPARRRISKLG